MGIRRVGISSFCGPVVDVVIKRIDARSLDLGILLPVEVGVKKATAKDAASLLPLAYPAAEPAAEKPQRQLQAKAQNAVERAQPELTEDRQGLTFQGRAPRRHPDGDL